MKYRSLLSAVILVALAIAFRTVWHLAPNLEFVTTASILAATYLGGPFAFLVPLAAMFISDLIIGNTKIFLFTWSAFIMIGLVNLRYLKLINSQTGERLIFAQTLYGVGAAIFFYLYTNFGVWWLDTWNMYPDTLAGLWQSYLMGLPFLRLQLVGNLLFISASFSLTEIVWVIIKQRWPNVCPISEH